MGTDLPIYFLHVVLTTLAYFVFGVVPDSDLVELGLPLIRAVFLTLEVGCHDQERLTIERARHFRQIPPHQGPREILAADHNGGNMTTKSMFYMEFNVKHLLLAIQNKHASIYGENLLLIRNKIHKSFL